MPRLTFGFLIWLLAVIGIFLGGAHVAYATHTDPVTGDELPHATYRYWDLVTGPGGSVLQGFDPHETLDDVKGATGHVGAPTIVTAMENACGGSCSIMYWNPQTNKFKTVCVTGGLDFAVDVNRSSTAGGGMPGSFGGGDAWSAVHFNSLFSPWVNPRGSNQYRAYNVGVSDATGVRVDPGNGKVYMGSFGTSSPGGLGRIIELDPVNNTARSWTIRNRPYFLAISGRYVFATAVVGGGHPDQIVRLDPVTNEVTRWNVPGAPNFRTFVAFGNPNYISVDPTSPGKLWFSETESNEIGLLDTARNTITEFTKPGIDGPNAVANSGSQAFFTEEGSFPVNNGHTSLLLSRKAAGVETPLTPIIETVPPVALTVSFFDNTGTVIEATIEPKTFDSECVDPDGIFRCPVPPDTNTPTGMTGVAFPNQIFGSIEGSNHVFELTSKIIEQVPSTPGRVTAGGKIENGTVIELATMLITNGTSAGSEATFGGVVELKSTITPIKGEWQHNDHQLDLKIHAKEFDSLVITNGAINCPANLTAKTAKMMGTGTMSSSPPGTMVDVEIEVQDCGEPGSQQPMLGVATGPDHYSIKAGSYAASGPLIGGNVQIQQF
jgi:hypothetical protein